MNWIDEKVKEYRTWLASSINNGLLVPRTAEEVDHWLRTALTEAHAKGAQEALAKVKEWVKANEFNETYEFRGMRLKIHNAVSFDDLLHYLQQLKDNKDLLAKTNN